MHTDVSEILRRRDRPLGRRTRRWDHNIQMDLETKVCVKWIHVVPYRDGWRALVNMAITKPAL